MRDRSARRRVGLSENRAGVAGKTNERAGLHCLQGDDFVFAERAFALEAAFGGKIEHLPACHAADAGRARQRSDQRDPHLGVGVNRLARHDVEGQRQQRVAGEDRGRLVEGLVHGRLAAAQVVIVHRRQVVMHQRIAVQQFERAAGEQRAIAWRAEQSGGLDHEERTQALAAAERAGAHGLQQARRPRRFARQHRTVEQMREQRFAVGGDGGQAVGEIGRCHAAYLP